MLFIDLRMEIKLLCTVILRVSVSPKMPPPALSLSLAELQCLGFIFLEFPLLLYDTGPLHMFPLSGVFSVSSHTLSSSRLGSHHI